MRYFLTLIFMTFTMACAPAFASGKLSLQNNFPDGGSKYRPTFGLSVYEPITKSIAANFWTGYGEQFLEERDDVNWWVSKAQVDFNWKALTVSPGVQYKVLVSEGNEKVAVGFVRLDYKLW